MRISIEGLPGSGKTTILKILEKMGHNCYMEGEHRLPSEIKVTTSEISAVAAAATGVETSEIETEKETVKLIESSPYVLKRLWNNLTNNSSISYKYPKRPNILQADWTPDLIIFLDCQPDISVKRLSKASKSLVPRANKLSAVQITDLYQQLELILHPVNCDIPVYRINATRSILHTLHAVLAVLNTII